jgi:hypothetical protein
MSNDRISKRALDTLTCPPDKDRFILWDSDLKGFGVCAFLSGSKVYVAQYRKDGRSRRTTIGDHGRLTPQEARSEAKKILGAVEQGVDPIEQRRAARGVRTLRDVADEFMQLHVAAKRKARTYEEYERVLKLHILPALGSRRITDIVRKDIARPCGFFVRMWAAACAAAPGRGLVQRLKPWTGDRPRRCSPASGATVTW